jgi:hypothetical protein
VFFHGNKKGKMYCSGVCSTYFLYVAPLISLTSKFFHCRPTYAELFQIIITKQSHSYLFHYISCISINLCFSCMCRISMRSFTLVVMTELFSYKNCTLHYLRCSYQRTTERFGCWIFFRLQDIFVILLIYSILISRILHHALL